MIKKSVQNYTGCLLGGAIGDALGAPIEFNSLDLILQDYGKKGVVDFIEYKDGIGAFTDDTQMLLFTSEGLLRGIHKAYETGTPVDYVSACYQSYLRWLITQNSTYSTNADIEAPKDGWIFQQQFLHKQRAPGTTCLSSLRSKDCGSIINPINDSKGCGGIMRIAPVGLINLPDAETAFRVGAELAAITHGHPSGYLSAGCFASIIHLINQGESLMDAINTTIDLLVKCPMHGETLTAIEKAIDLYKEGTPDYYKLENLGGGWTGEEALSISIYAALCFPNNFEDAVNLSANHSGDCDSTASLTGNLIGLIVGEENIPDKWKNNLRHADFIRQVAIDLHTELDIERLDEWRQKYPAN